MSQILASSCSGGTINTITSTGATITVTNPNGPITNLETVAPGFIWESLTTVTKTAEVNKGYITTNVAQIDITLPAVAPVGSVIEVLGNGLNSWQISQPAGVFIEWNETLSTTVGVGGFLGSTDNYDAVALICTTADLVWGVKASKGNIIII